MKQLLLICVASAYALPSPRCDKIDALGRLARSAYSRLVAVHCATGESETKTKRLSHVFNPIFTNNIFWYVKL